MGFGRFCGGDVELRIRGSSVSRCCCRQMIEHTVFIISTPRLGEGDVEKQNKLEVLPDIYPS